MTIIEHRTMKIICSNLPEIAKQLKRIADELTCQTQLMINTKLDGRKENDNAA